MSTNESMQSELFRRAQAVRVSKAPNKYALSLKFISTVVLLPTVGIALVCYCVLVVWTVTISFTNSHLLPTYQFIGWHQYVRLFASARWWIATENLAIYGACLICGSTLFGYLLAILIDRGTRWVAVYRTILMLPLSVSYVASGVIWLWLLNPGLGIQHAVRDLGWQHFAFDWLVRSDRAIYTIAIVGIWQQSGLCMALFLAALRGIDPNIWKTSSLDGVPLWRMYLHVITPTLRSAFVTVAVLLFANAIKTYDLVVTLTGGGPGFSSDLPAYDVVELMNRHEIGMSAAGACLLLGTVAAIVGPFIYWELRRQRLDR